MIAHPAERSGWLSAFALSGGVAIFLLGVAASRRSLSIGSPGLPAFAALVVLATTPIATMVNAGLQLVAVLGVVVVMLTLDARGGAAVDAGSEHATT